MTGSVAEKVNTKSLFEFGGRYNNQTTILPVLQTGKQDSVSSLLKPLRDEQDKRRECTTEFRRKVYLQAIKEQQTIEQKR